MLQQFRSVVVFVVVLLHLTLCSNAFQRGISGQVVQRESLARNMFNFGGKAAAAAADTKKSFSITVDGKDIIVGDEKSGDKVTNLRKILLNNKVDVYPLRAKITGNCGGAGICGTCAVKVIEGAQNINPPSKNEQNTLKGKPADFRLACCSKVNGPIKIKTKP